VSLTLSTEPHGASADVPALPVAPFSQSTKKVSAGFPSTGSTAIPTIMMTAGSFVMAGSYHGRMVSAGPQVDCTNARYPTMPSHLLT
jgi:hypothetical protein